MEASLEVKKGNENLLNHKLQLLNYLISFKCEVGLLFNSEESLMIKNNNKVFYENQVTDLNEIVIEIISYIIGENLDLEAFIKATNGDLKSFLYLIKKYGKYNHKISFKIKGCNIINGYLFRIKERGVNYDFYENS